MEFSTLSAQPLFSKPFFPSYLTSKGNYESSTSPSCVGSDYCPIFINDDPEVIMYQPVKKQKMAGQAIHIVNGSYECDGYSPQSQRLIKPTKVVSINKIIEQRKQQNEDLDPRKRIIQKQLLTRRDIKPPADVICVDSDSDEDFLRIPTPPTDDEKDVNTAKDEQNNSNMFVYDEFLKNQFLGMGSVLALSNLGYNVFPQISMFNFNLPTLNLFSGLGQLPVENMSFSMIGANKIDFNQTKANINYEYQETSLPNETILITDDENDRDLGYKKCCEPLESVNIKEDSDKFAVIPELIIKRDNQIGKKKPLRLVWNPECLEDRVLEDYLEKMGKVIGIKITNQEKGVRMLLKFGMNINAVVVELKKNLAYYKNYFRVDPRVLRNKIPLF